MKCRRLVLICRMAPQDDQIIAFDRFELDPGRGELRCEGQTVEIEPKALDLIAHLARHPGEVQSRDDLIAAVWDGRIVSDSAVSSCVASARKALGDSGTAQRYIRSIPRRGFRFEADIQKPGRSTALTLPEKPSVAVLPFQNMSGDPDQVYFSDGITDDIITDLSRYDELFVIARHSSFAFRDTVMPAVEVAKDLGVQYLAEGSVRRAGERIRVTARLIDPWAGNELWAERYDRESTDIFEIQDDITAVIVNSLAGAISRQHYRRLLTKSAESVHAYDRVLKATEHGLRVNPDDNKLAREESEKAIAIDPGFARAHAILALTYVNEGNNFWVEDQERSFRRAYEAGRAAVAADHRDPWAHAMLGVSELWHSRSYDQAIMHMENSVELNPTNAHFRGIYAYVLTFVGQADKALEEIKIAIRMDPQCPPLFHGFRGRAFLALRRIEEALRCQQQQVALMPGHSNALAYAAVAYAAAGRTEEARATVEALRASNPFYRAGPLARHLPFKDRADTDFIVDTLRDAGLPE